MKLQYYYYEMNARSRFSKRSKIIKSKMTSNAESHELRT